MRPWRGVGALLLTASLLAAEASSQSPAGDASLSPAGEAIYADFVRRPDPALLRCLGEAQAISQKLAAAGQRPTLDWPTARALIAQQADRQAGCTRLAQAQSLALLDRLPPADRLRYFKRLYGSTSNPVFMLAPVGQSR